MILIFIIIFLIIIFYFLSKFIVKKEKLFLADYDKIKYCACRSTKNHPRQYS